MAPPRIVARPFFQPPTESLRYLPEAPRVLQNHPEGSGLLGWVAIQHAAGSREGSINVLDLASGVNRSFPLPGRPGFFAETTKPGVVLVGLERRLAYCDLTSGEVEESGITVTDDERVIVNDGLGVEGGVLFGTKDLQFARPIAALYFFDAAARALHTVFGGQICSNGKILARDAAGATLFDIDSQPRTITRYRLDAALSRILERSLVVDPHSLPGFPDGLRPSPDGQSAILAIYNPGPSANGLCQEIRLSDGAVLCEWEIPGSPRVTCPEFVEIGGQVKLLFTTAVEGMPAETRALAPGAGTLYLADAPRFHTLPAPPPLVPPF